MLSGGVRFYRESEWYQLASSAHLMEVHLLDNIANIDYAHWIALDPKALIKPGQHCTDPGALHSVSASRLAVKTRKAISSLFYICMRHRTRY